MNKLLTGTVAGAAGIALLLGGGTFALWNTSATVAAGTVTSGNLAIDTTSFTPTWQDVSIDKTPTTITTSSFLLVPGDTIKLTQHVHVTATGTNLNAKLTYDATTVTGAITGTTVTFAATGTGVTSTATPNVYAITVPSSGVDVTCTLTIDFPSSTTGTTGTAQSINLTALGIKLYQTRP
jgi:alternate signal-mediated exported protein